MHQEERQGRGWSSRDVSREIVPSESFFQPGPQDFVASGRVGVLISGMERQKFRF